MAMCPVPSLTTLFPPRNHFESLLKRCRHLGRHVSIYVVRILDGEMSMHCLPSILSSGPHSISFLWSPLPFTVPQLLPHTALAQMPSNSHHHRVLRAMDLHSYCTFCLTNSVFEGLLPEIGTRYKKARS